MVSIAVAVDRAVLDNEPRLDDDVSATLHTVALQCYGQRRRTQPIQTTCTLVSPSVCLSVRLSLSLSLSLCACVCVKLWFRVKIKLF